MTQNDPETTDQDNPGRLRQMYEEASRANAEATARVAELERREAFRDAGLDLNNPLHRVVAEGYKGELETDKVTEYVGSLNLPTVEPPTPSEPDIPERAAMERMAQASQGDGGPTSEPDRVATLKEELRREAAKTGGGNIQQLDRIARELDTAQGGMQLRP